MTTDNDHASEGIDQSGFTNEPQTVLTRRSPIRWTVGVIVRYVITLRMPVSVVRIIPESE